MKKAFKRGKRKFASLIHTHSRAAAAAAAAAGGGAAAPSGEGAAEEGMPAPGGDEEGVVAVKTGTRPPWVGLGAAVWVQMAAGSGYTFPLYSHSLKSVLGLTQQQLTILGVANDVGENVGVLPGVACNRLPPWAVLLIGAACSFVGFGALWLAVSRTVTSIPYWMLWIALVVATNSSAWLGTGVVVTNMRNFPLSRGTVAGLLKGYAGLSAAVYTEIYAGVLRDSSTKLLLLLTLGIPAISLLSMYFIRPCTPVSGDGSSERGHFLFIQVASVLLGVYLLITTLLDDVLTVNDVVSYTFVGGMVLLLLSPLLIPLKMTFFRDGHRKPAANGLSSLEKAVSAGYPNKSESVEPLLSVSPSPSLEQAISGYLDKSGSVEPPLSVSPPSTKFGNFQESDDVSDVDTLLAEGEGAVKKKRKPRRGEDFEFHEALVKADFWLLFLVYFLGVGSGVTVLNNLAQIGIASNVEDTTILLSLFSFCNFIGRLGGGVISEHFVRSRALPRSIWMACTQLIMVLVFLLFASALNSTLYASVALLGFCYGVQICIMVPTASELFGLKHFGVIYNFLSLGNPIGAFLFSGLLAGYVYDREAARQRRGLQDAPSSSCLGPDCFRVTFLVLAAVCGFGCLLSLVLTVRIRPVYEMLYSGGSFRLRRSPQHS
ncbi:hypothetical protein Taro_015589 [Colocasia esculenta]|uniref:Nodulin-like domain-containing protein n=1 Tax=Colocasia esculenta TaxID=4460 RepID=A0A843UHX2_COLES|nr:hypothetical protein [Colocasia esculenta]